MALWNVNWFGPCSDADSSDIVTRAASINYFCKHSVSVKGVNKTHLLANLSWFLYHPKNTQLGKPITIKFGITTFLNLEECIRLYLHNLYSVVVCPLLISWIMKRSL